MPTPKRMLAFSVASGGCVGSQCSAKGLEPNMLTVQRRATHSYACQCLSIHRGKLNAGSNDQT